MGIRSISGRGRFGVQAVQLAGQRLALLAIAVRLGGTHGYLLPRRGFRVGLVQQEEKALLRSWVGWVRLRPLLEVLRASFFSPASATHSAAADGAVQFTGRKGPSHS